VKRAGRLRRLTSMVPKATSKVSPIQAETNSVRTCQRHSINGRQEINRGSGLSATWHPLVRLFFNNVPQDISLYSNCNLRVPSVVAAQQVLAWQSRQRNQSSVAFSTKGNSRGAADWFILRGRGQMDGTLAMGDKGKGSGHFRPEIART
jgi:hypothetical protein